MKVMIDVVYNHTSPDAVLLEEHPDFYYRDAEGKPGNRIGDWSDVIDLDYRNHALWDYQIESLQFWASIVDGFRCDVASFVPLDFWRAARAAVARVNPGCVWLAETVHMSFGNFARREGFTSSRDTEAFDAFDIEYQYDVNYNKLRFLENHDQPRFRARVTSETAADNYTAMLFFLKGTALLYAGQEFSCTHRPSLFEREVFDRSGRDISALVARLAAIRKECFGEADAFTAEADDRHAIAVMERVGEEGRSFGIFSLRGKSAAVRVEVPDGEYENLIDGSTLIVENGQVFCGGSPIIFTLRR